MLEWLGLILGVLGLFGVGGLIAAYDRSIGRWWFLRTWTPERVKEEVEKLARNHVIEFREPQNVASFGPDICVRYFVDFLSAVTTNDGKRLLERCILRWIRLHFSALPDKIAVPKLGNVILAESVASRLGVPLVIVRQESDLFIRGGHPLEGKLASDDRVLLVDDVASDGEFLARCVSHIEDFSAKVTGVVCLVNRTDANAEKVLEAKGVKLTSITQLADRDLEGASGKPTALGQPA